MFTYIRPAKFNVKILNGRKSLANVFGLVILKIPRTNNIIPLHPSYYMPQNTISQTALKHYNKSRMIRTEALRWLQMATDKGNKPKVETKVMD